MDTDITHDSLYLNYLNRVYGPNLLPIIKLMSAIVGFLFILIIILSNLGNGTNTNSEEEPKKLIFEESIVIKQKTPL